MKSLQDFGFIPKPSPHLPIPTANLPASLPFSTLSTPKSRPHPIATQKIPSSPKFSPTHLPIPLQIDASTQKIPHSFDSAAAHLKKLIPLMPPLSFPLSAALAAETEQASDKINIEAIVVSIDDFFNRYPFFVAGCAFIWLVAIPLAQEYLKKYKFVSAFDAFRRLSDLPNSQLLDIRKRRSIDYLNSPSLKSLNKSVVQVEFVEGEEDGFVKEALKRFGDPGDTVLCVLDSFDGNSLKVAELLFENGFKEVYAIKGGLRGKDGWQAIQETLLPPSVHVYPSKKKRKSSVHTENGRSIDEESSGNGKAPPSFNIKQGDNENTENGHTRHMDHSPEETLANYPDLKPPSSPTPSNPQS